MNFIWFTITLLIAHVSFFAMAQNLPKSDIKKHPFLYAGEWQNKSLRDQQMFVVKDGKVVWSYMMPAEGEYGDAFMLSNGNIVFSRKDGASEITKDKTIVWNFTPAKGTEIHTCQPLGLERVFMVLNEVPAKAIILKKKDNTIEKELVLPTGGTSPHGMFRHCRYTAQHTFLVAHMDMDKVAEYDGDGKELWSVSCKSPWAAIRLRNGNTLVSGNSYGYVREFDPKGQVVWEFTREDAPSWLKIYTIQEVNRLANGNTLISNWCAGAQLTDEERDNSIQFFEVNSKKEIVWTLSSWKDPNLGPASTIQLLDEPGIPENGDLQK